MNNIKIRTAGDVMREAAKRQEEMKLQNNIVLRSKNLPNRHRMKTGDGEHEYCPYCVQRAKRGDKDNWKVGLNPLWTFTRKSLINCGTGIAKIRFDQIYECDVCKKEITEEDYLKCRPAETVGIYYIDLSKVDVNSPEFLENF